MKIYETAVRKPISTILIFVGVIVFGLFSLNNLAVDQYPDIDGLSRNRTSDRQREVRIINSLS